MFEKLKKNLEQEKKIVADMRSIEISMQSGSSDRDFYVSSLNSLAQQLMFLNSAVPELLKEGSPIAKFAEDSTKVDSIRPVKVAQKKSPETPVRQASGSSGKGVVSMNYVSPSTKEKRYITINKKDRKEFLKELKLSEEAIVGIKKIKAKESGIAVAKPSNYARISNKFFRRYSERISPQFSGLKSDLKKANIRFLLSSYLSMAIMSTVLAFVFGLLFFTVLLFFSFSNWIFFVLPFGFAGLTLAGFYLYPAAEADSVQKKISYELPFVSIHMSAIAGSNIAPVKIFKIIMESPEYPNIGKEIRKVITQIDIFGYDLGTSLKNVAMRTSNRKLAELFSGMATNISTGGSLKNYLEKKSETFLLDYRLEREQYSALAGTFMDVYISILIAAPLVLMMMFIVMNVAGLALGGLGIETLLALSIVAIIIVNIIFIVVLNMKQPKV